ncbi:hypothetical protein CQA49_06650 [Helicobacter sp. MIT 00-7814]|uniref:hypothetical protein n=1 Tax=unclassified Helicobacter TaxID=2593540 RepID=UPI000E1E6880|nr:MULTISPECIES: hypothetical protein [unclassified Helicobacter]RDU53322.1 hypothetical protein CQA49_06650 [Helicobacter sp. MIT 00-7814]RDU54143.1 hypothetical protein CQA37_05890 [Helicobacter sp. MIT 99-10781]
MNDRRYQNALTCLNKLEITRGASLQEIIEEVGKSEIGRIQKIIALCKRIAEYYDDEDLEILSHELCEESNS